MNDAGVFRICAISGSLRRMSSNGALIEAARRLAPPGVDISIYRDLASLPPFNPDLDAEDPPEAVSLFRRAVAEADALLISSPEYAHGVPGVLKNALDWIVGSGELIDKPVALINASARATHAYASLRETLTTMSGRLVDAASITLSLDGAGRDATAILNDSRLSAPLSAAVTALVDAARDVAAPGLASTGAIQPTPDEVQYLEDRIYEFNSEATGIADGDLLAFLVRDHDRIVAGICGNTWGGTCELRQFWVDASKRHRGLGTKLLQAAEHEARRRGCTQIVLMTFSFQAPAFYERHGFDVVATIHDHPRGYQNLLMRKVLQPES